MEVIAIINNDSNGVYNNTRGKVASTQKTLPNHRHTIVDEPIKHSSKKKKVEEVVEPLIKYHPKCTSNCKDYNNNKSIDDIQKSNEYYNTQSHKFKSFENKSGYIQLCKELGTHYGIIENPCNGKTSWYMLPLAPNRQHTNLLCSMCFRSQFKLLDSRAWKEALHPHTTIDEEPSTGGADDLYNVLKYTLTQQKENNCAVVVPPSFLNEYNTRIILQSPTLNSSPHCGDGIMCYGDWGYYNNEPVKFNKHFSLPSSGSTVICVRKDELDQCLKKKGKTQQYTYRNCNIGDDDVYVILSIQSIRDDCTNELHPQDDDLSLFKQYKDNILPPGKNNHYNSDGWYFAIGGTATYNAESLGQYTTKPHEANSPSYESFLSRIKGAENVVKNAITNLESTAAGYEMVHAGSESTLQNRKHCTMLNRLLQSLGSDNIDLTPFYQSGIYPSMNINVNAGTGIYHTENDQGYTLIASLFQLIDYHATFHFKINPKCILHIPLTGGVNLLFNARLLTHRQDNTQVKNKNGCFWNIGCYANRRYNTHTFATFRRKLSFVLDNLDAVYGNRNSNEV